MSWGSVIRGELQDFEAMITPVGVHDDRVISVAMAVRRGLQRPLPERGEYVIVPPGTI